MDLLTADEQTKANQIKNALPRAGLIRKQIRVRAGPSLSGFRLPSSIISDQFLLNHSTGSVILNELFQLRVTHLTPAIGA